MRSKNSYMLDMLLLVSKYQTNT